MYKWKLKVINHLTALTAQSFGCVIFWDPLAICSWLGDEKDKILIPLKSIEALQLAWSEESFDPEVVGQNYGTKHRRNEDEKKTL